MKRKGPWSSAQSERFLADARLPVRLACNGVTGHPMLVSLWFVPLDGRLWCATQRSAAAASLIAGDARCAFEVSVEAPPYCGVRGRGIATLHPERGEEILHALIERYLGASTSRLARLLLARAAQETAIEILPKTLVSWDYRERMGDAV